MSQRLLRLSMGAHETSGQPSRPAIPFSPPDIREEDIEAVAEVLRSGWITTGPRTKAFEWALSDFAGTPRTAALASATAAMELTLRILGVGPGDEVITTAYTYTASASVILHTGATVVLVDSAPGEYHIDLEAVTRAVTPRTKAVIAVDVAGIMCDHRQLIERLAAQASSFRPASPLQDALGRVTVIADAAHSLGASRQGLCSGQAADFTCFSMHAVKNLTTGEGGAITWRRELPVDHDALYTQFMQTSLHGQTRDALTKARRGGWEYDVETPAYKANLTDIASALGLSQLRRYPRALSRRHELVSLYRELLGDGVTVINHRDEDQVSSAHLLMVDLQGRGGSVRNRLIEGLAERQVASNVHYKPLPMLTAYRRLGFDARNFPNAMERYENEITLPLHTQLTEAHIERIASDVRDLVG